LTPIQNYFLNIYKMITSPDEMQNAVRYLQEFK